MAKGPRVMCTSPSAVPALPSLPYHWRLGLKGLVPVLYPTAGTWGRSDTQETGLSRVLLGCQQELVMLGPHHFCLGSLCPAGCCAHGREGQTGGQTHVLHMYITSWGTHTCACTCTPLPTHAPNMSVPTTLQACPSPPIPLPPCLPKQEGAGSRWEGLPSTLVWMWHW